MKHWVFTARVEPPSKEVVSARFGGSVIFAAYSRVLRQWYWVYPGGEQRIAEPPMIFLDDKYVETHERLLSKVERAKLSRRSTKAVQLSLFR